MWNTYWFFTTYADADGITAADLASASAPADRPELDRWILSVLQGLIDEVNRQMEGYYLFNVVPPILGFVEDLTNWYVRRARRRFWRRRDEDDGDKLAAFATLYEVLTTFAKVVAPVLPFVAERIYQDLVVAIDPDAPPSVHLCDFPREQPALIDRQLERAMASVREVVSIGHGLRKQHQLKVRRPLHSVTVITHNIDAARAVAEHTALISEELNAKAIVVSASSEGLLTMSARPDYARLGPRFGARVKEVAGFVAALGEHQLQALLDGAGLEVAGSTITAADLVIDRNPLPGVAVAAGEGLAVALSLETSPELEAEGLAREFVSRIQQMRRGMGLLVTDRIEIDWWSDNPTVIAALEAHQQYIVSETLAVAFRAAETWEGETDELEGAPYGVRISPVPKGVS